MSSTASSYYGYWLEALASHEGTEYNELSVEDIASHIEWLDVIRNNFSFTKVNAKELEIKAAKGNRGDFIG